MRLSTAPWYSTALILGSVHSAVSALTLSYFQPINGFDAACTNAYNTPLTDCTLETDFASQGCSKKCIGFLDSLQTTMASNCAGTGAYEDTLIGLFLAGQGVHTLCSNVPSGGSSSSGGGAGGGQSQGQTGASVIGVQSAVGDSSTSTTDTTSSATVVYTTPTSSTPQAAATSSTTTIVPTTIAPEPTTTSVAVVGTTVMPESPSTTSTSTSRTTSTTSSSSTSTSTNGGNGGGTPLDIGSSAVRHGAEVRLWWFFSLMGSAGVVWLL